jgi:hypothetical protein
MPSKSQTSEHFPSKYRHNLTLSENKLARNTSTFSLFEKRCFSKPLARISRLFGLGPSREWQISLFLSELENVYETACEN